MSNIGWTQYCSHDTIYPMLSNRYLKPTIDEFLEDRMVFIGGPRQVGKTTLACSFLGKAGRNSERYLNWDDLQLRKSIRTGEIPSEFGILVFDELHKYLKWRTLLKGFYDKFGEDLSILVTGSARLDHYRRGGDSLFGRYRYLRLHPFSLSELNKKPTKEDLRSLMQFGGFPEPLFKGQAKFHRLWQKERVERVVREDIRDLEKVREINNIELLLDLLPQRVGSPLSLRSIQEDLEVSHDSVRSWLMILENLYLTFRISPFGSPKIRAVKKEQKLYFWDWSELTSEGPKFENLVASHLLKYCHFIEDTEGYKMELRFIRDTDGREIDFVVLQDKKPLFAVECKTGEKQLSKAISYFAARTKIPEFYQVHLGNKDYGSATKGGRVLPFEKFVSEKGLV